MCRGVALCLQSLSSLSHQHPSSSQHLHRCCLFTAYCLPTLRASTHSPSRTSFYFHSLRISSLLPDINTFAQVVSTFSVVSYPIVPVLSFMFYRSTHAQGSCHEHDAGIGHRMHHQDIPTWCPSAYQTAPHAQGQRCVSAVEYHVITPGSAPGAVSHSTVPRYVRPPPPYLSPPVIVHDVGEITTFEQHKASPVANPWYNVYVIEYLTLLTLLRWPES